jgi:hypothetical protein
MRHMHTDLLSSGNNLHPSPVASGAPRPVHDLVRGTDWGLGPVNGGGGRWRQPPREGQILYEGPVNGNSGMNGLSIRATELASLRILPLSFLLVPI